MPHNEMGPWATTTMREKYSHTLPDGEKETWPEIAHRVVPTVMKAVDAPKALVKRIEAAVVARKIMPGGRYLYACGRVLHQTQNCLLMRADDSREGWAALAQKAILALMTGAGIGVDYSDVRAEGKPIRKAGGFTSGPLALMQMVNENSRGIRQGGDRRGAVWAGLRWDHADVVKFIQMKNWSPEVIAMKAKDYNFPATMDGTNISVGLNDEFFRAFNNESHKLHSHANSVYRTVIAQMVRTGEPGFSVDCGANKGETLRNACTEVTSKDDSDICNLGSINLARIDSLEEMEEMVELCTAFLLAGTVYSDVPYEKVDQVRTKNRRLGVGILGVHEWLLKHGKKYGPDDELEKYLKIYTKTTEFAAKYAEEWELSVPVKTRAVAPTGCQRGDTLVVTEDGILELSELGNPKGERWQNLGISVAQETGKEELAYRFFVNGNATTKKIKMSSGIELECTPNHQYRILKNGEYEWKRADLLSSKDLVVVALNTYHKITNPELMPVRKAYRTETVPVFPTTMTDDLAWFIGIFMADGSMHQKGIRISCNALRPEEYNKVADVGRRVFGFEPTLENNGRNCMSVCFSSQALLRWLYINGLDKPSCNEMEVPTVIRTASRNCLQTFMNGYWYGDGSRSGNNLYIDTVSEKLAVQWVILRRALGEDASISCHMSGMGSKMYRVNLVKTRRRCHTKDVEKSLNNLGLKNCTVDEVVSVEDSVCDTFDIEVPATTTYIANGVVSHNTIGIVAETTTGIEPIFCVAYKRRYLKHDAVNYQYVVDPCAKRLIESGIGSDSIEDAYSIDVERRVAFQAWVQQYVDHGISSTINIPAWGTETNNAGTTIEFGDILMKYLPKLRGITCYPDSARSGQPLTPVKYTTAIKHVGEVFVEQADVCEITKGGSCGA